MLPGLALGAAIVLAVLGWNLLLKPQVMPGAEWVESSLGTSEETTSRLLAAGSLLMAAILSLAMYVGVTRFLGRQYQIGPYPQLQRAWRSLRRK
jgi:hypothetical protein